MALFNRTSSSSSLKSEKSAANTKKNVRFSDQSPQDSFEKQEPLTKSAQCNNSEAEQKSSASAEIPEPKPSKPKDLLYEYNKIPQSDKLWNVRHHDMEQFTGVGGRLVEKLAVLTYGELLDFDKKVDPSLGYLKLYVERLLIARQTQELEIGLSLPG